MWIQAIPLADETDAKASMGDLFSRTLPNLRFRGRLVESRSGPGIGSLGEDASTLEQDIAMGDRISVTRYLVWKYWNVVSVLAASGPPETWTWETIAGIAEKLNRRIARQAEGRG